MLDQIVLGTPLEGCRESIIHPPEMRIISPGLARKKTQTFGNMTSNCARKQMPHLLELRAFPCSSSGHNCPSIPS